MGALHPVDIAQRAAAFRIDHGEAHNLVSNTRLRWTIRPGTDLLVVWNLGWQRLILAPRDLSLVPDSELLAVKLKWTFRR